MNLERALTAAPDPMLAHTAWERVCADGSARAILERPAVAPVAIQVLGLSSAAADFLVKYPEEAGLFATATSRSRANLDAEVAADVKAHGAASGLRRFRRRAMVRVAARDLGGAGLDEVVHEITDIADACWAAACSAVPGADRLAVIALGKWGGRELNYSSDVDLLFVHDRSTPEDNELAEHAAGALLRLLSDQTADGVALRVDTGLRPGGRAGALSRSLDATLAYYDGESATWERQAMIKARAAAGDQMLGYAFVTGVAPFVYPERLEPAAIDDVRRTKVRLEEYIRQRGKELIEVKRGRGGIRDVEFAVQLLQIVHGRRNPTLRSPNTLAALQALADEGYVAEADANALAEAYRFLRQLEHRLQIVRDLQTHDLPSDPHARTTIARSLGLIDAERLQEEYDRTTGLVRSIHERLFYRPLLEAFAGPAQPRQGVDRTATQELLEGLGFAQPVRSYEVLARLVDPATRLGKVLGHVIPVMTPAIAMAADPDAALVRLERVAEAVGERGGPADALATDPKAAWRLAHLVGASRFADRCARRRPRGGCARSPTGSCTPTTHRPTWCGWSRRYAGRELSPVATGAEIAAVGDRVLREAVDEVAPAVPLAVIGMGKLGAREPSFASDLDVVFVYEGEGAEEQRVASEAAERIMRRVREAGWEIDADLRPEGRNGPLARSIAGFLEYWERYAEPWEFQALLRARAVAGDEALGKRFTNAAGDLAYPPDGITIDRVLEIRRMRERIERERVRPAEADEVPFQARVRVARRRAVRCGDAAAQQRRARARGPHDEHPAGDRASRGASARRGVRRARPRRGVRLPERRQVRDGGRPPRARRGGAADGRGADRARSQARLRGVPAPGVHGRLPPDHAPLPPRDGTRLHRGCGITLSCRLTEIEERVSVKSHPGTPRSKDSEASVVSAAKIEHPSVAERKARGKGLRDTCSPKSHAGWAPAQDRPDPVALLEEQNKTREPDLVPVRHGRMMVSPFTFYRGAAKIMAADLKDTPRAGLVVQLCGDAHLSNFGVFASPERTLLFDLNDFDETLPGPFEYDVKRMAASFTIAARNNGFTRPRHGPRRSPLSSAYREAMAGFAQMGTMDIWYARLSEKELMAAIKNLARSETGVGQEGAQEGREGREGDRRQGTHARQPAGALQAGGAGRRQVPDRQPATNRRSQRRTCRPRRDVPRRGAST